MRTTLAALSLLLMLLAASLASTIAAVTPPARNIVYVHVPTAICSLLSFCVLFFCSIQYLRTKHQNPLSTWGHLTAGDGLRQWDHTAAAAAETGLFFATVMNLTGIIFARLEWGIWWTPSPRLISSAVLWFLYAAYLLLRAAFASEHRKETISAVFGIIAFIDVPLVLISARFVPDIHRPSFSFDTPAQLLALASAILGSVLLMALLIFYLKLSKERPPPHKIQP